MVCDASEASSTDIVIVRAILWDSVSVKVKNPVIVRTCLQEENEEYNEFSSTIGFLCCSCLSV